MWPIIVVVMFAVILVYVLTRKARKEELPHVTYVCDVCGERDCLCHREDAEDRKVKET
jgi:hypothetical protein